MKSAFRIVVSLVVLFAAGRLAAADKSADTDGGADALRRRVDRGRQVVER